MRTLKKITSFLFSRFFVVAVMLIIQLALIAALVILASLHGLYAYLIFNLISFIIVLTIISNNENPSYKITWIVAILIFPLTGGVFYLILGNKRLPSRLTDFARSALEQTKKHMPDNHLCDQRLWPASGALALQSQHIYTMSGYPTWEDCHSEYFPLGELMFERMLQEIKKARRYIFLEYFIVSPGEMWEKLFAALREKIWQGVEVRLLYDDLGCMRLPKIYEKLIREAGIRLCVFNPFHPRVSVILNYRDHRKLCVIDGGAAFCGGINIADEYINLRRRYGHWKDTGVMIRGPAVWGFTFMYLQQWQFATNTSVDYSEYRPAADLLCEGKGLVQVFGDSPLDRVNVTEAAYRNIISRATGYVYITTPYLVIDYEMETALCTAAQSGVDVRIITPFHYDKWYVHMLTCSHYPRLLRAGVRVFEYTPGFMHGKTYVSDDSVCMIGTCNMDFRSFHLHFECSATFYQSDTVLRVRDDFLGCQEQSREITLEESLNVSFFTRVARSILKIFAPLM